MFKRTGTPKFIARSVSSGKLLNEDEFSSAKVKLPQIEGVLVDYQQFMHTKEHQAQVDDSPGSTTLPEAKFAHRLFHDAESTFWVIAWTLARSIKTGSEQEKAPDALFRLFFFSMSTHCPTPRTDPRKQFSYDDWEFILHPDLAALAPMLANMFKYIRPEWAYRPELNAEHVHEALMRLLLIEIVNIKNGTDIDIHIGGRDSPPPPPGQGRLPECYGLP
ncbi:putative kinase domain protein [Rhizoctonia solani 123E]|uniref:Putative kinase domain protein n=1 Tax=Rhizoctonia solani 123E TaxID=1423351 RepID=A0A074SLZ2_9AGAM|nr:putative kinase domain protein [Rhizoctonia solani 123E]